VGRPLKHRVECEIDELTWSTLVAAGFEFSPRIREFLEGYARLELAARGITDFDRIRRNVRATERKEP
jgi:phenylalanine-4-hydroxylase